MDVESEDDLQIQTSVCESNKPPSDDLTSLTWLQNINILTVPGPPTPPASPKPNSKKSHRIPVLKEAEAHEYR